MCGIAGFVDFKKGSTESILRKMSCSIPHRGPDGEGVYFSESPHGQVGLGHRRLSIIDLSEAGNQPMHYNGLHLIFNGEIYNYQEIKEELIQLGHNFTSHSDSEVILHSWQQWGEKCMDRWRGMFALAIYDENQEKLVLIRDRAGVKPLYYYWDGSLFLFGSELKTIMQHDAFKKVIDPNAVGLYLQYGAVPQPYCIFRNTAKLSAGHYLVLDLGKRNFNITQYWNVYDYYNQPKLKIGLDEAIEETERILIDSFKYRMVSDVPVGVFLSGGYDSSCVTALLQKNHTERIKTFTIGSTDKALDEAPYAKQVAEYLGTDHTEYYCSPEEALAIIPQLSDYYDEPFADPSAVPTMLVSRLARQKVVVALSADGGDEVFGGYNRYEYISKFAKFNAIPRPVRKLAALAMDNVAATDIPFVGKNPKFSNRYNKILNLLNNPTMGELLLNLSQAFKWVDVQRIMRPSVTELPSGIYSKELKKEYYDDLSFMMAIDFQTYLVDDILQKVDRATMSVSLEGREPFLDQNIIAWAARLPSDFKLRNGQKKFILKQIVHRHLPKSMMERPKLGFGIPLTQWLRNELKPMVQDHLQSGSFGHDLFDRAEVDRILKDFYSGITDDSQKVWSILMFQLWYKKYGT